MHDIEILVDYQKYCHTHNAVVIGKCDICGEPIEEGQHFVKSRHTKCVNRRAKAFAHRGDLTLHETGGDY